MRTNIKQMQLSILFNFLQAAIDAPLKEEDVQVLLDEIMGLTARGRKVEAIGLLKKYGKTTVVATTNVPLTEDRPAFSRVRTALRYPLDPVAEERHNPHGNYTLLRWDGVGVISLAEAKALVDILVSMRVEA